MIIYFVIRLFSILLDQKLNLSYRYIQLIFINQIITFMDKFITQYVEPLFENTLTAQARQQKLTLLQTDLKIFVSSFVKNQVATVNKELAKKSRQLFILSSDNQSLKQAIQQAQSSLQQSKHQISALQQQKIKQKLVLDRQIAQLNLNIDNLDKEMKKQIAKMKMQKDVMEESYKVKIRELKNQSQASLNKAIDQQKRLQEEQRQTMMKQFEDEKNKITKQNSEKKREIIKKYEDQISKITGQYEDKLYLLNKQYENYKKESKDAKYNFQSKIADLQNNISRLKSELAREQQAHRKYLEMYKNTNQQLSEHQQKAIKQKQKVEQQLHQVKMNLLQQQRKYTVDMKNLNTLFKDTVEQKDKKYTETVETMSTQFRVQIESLQTQLIQQKQIAVTQVQIKRDKQNYDHEVRYQALKQQLQELKKRYTKVASEYEEKIQKMTEDHEDYVASLNHRKQYELSVTGKNAERQFVALRNKYELEIKSIYSQHGKQVEQLGKKHNDDKIALTNKLTTQYESMISDQKASNEIQIKQKLIQFDRKAKGYEAKLKDAQKKRNQLKVASQRIKMQMQMRIQSMVELNEVYETEIVNMNQKVQNVERDKQRIINEYELKLLIVKNQMKATKQQYQTRQVQLKHLLQSRLNTKNQQINKLLARVKKQTEALIQAHEKRVQSIQKQYNQLKRVVGQKTSLPEDIEALKVFHDAYLQKQKQVLEQKKKVEHLYRQLRAKDAIDKVFAQKGPKKVFKNNNISISMPGTLLSFKSNQI